MIVYAVIFLLLIYAVYKERQALGCPSIPTGKDCNNEDSKAAKGTKSSDSDSTPILINKLRSGASYSFRHVEWRSFFILSVLASIITSYMINKRFPTEVEMCVISVVICFLLCSFRCFYEFHLHSIIRRNVNETIDILQKRVCV